MAIHTCRDFIVLPSTQPSSSMYVSALFLFGVMGFTQVGQTQLDLSGSYMVASGLSASINFGVTGSFSAVGVPSWYTVSPSDVGRILALRSDLNPRFNSGLFRVSAVQTVTNRLVIEYRSPDDPPVETNTLTWALFLPESSLGGPSPYQAAGGVPTTGSGYKSYGSSYADKRIVLQSPHTSSWQVRFCHESIPDRVNYQVMDSVAPGFGGDSRGDFSTGSLDQSSPLAQHLHGPLWFNVSDARYKGTVVGIEGSSGGSFTDYGPATHRMYAWCDSVSGSAVFVRRNLSGDVDSWFSFGLAEDDEQFKPPLTIQRMFVMGRANGQAQDVYWNNGPSAFNKYTGVSFGLVNQPVNCVMAMYEYASAVGVDGGIKAETTAVDNAILSATELQRVDLWAGTQESGVDVSNNWPTNSVLHWDPRRLGSMPIARLGRANFGNWTLTTDAGKSWLHTKNGVFLPWSGPGIFV